MRLTLKYGVFMLQKRWSDCYQIWVLVSTTMKVTTMKISEVPQDEIKTLQGVKKALYAVDDRGHYTRATTSGWEEIGRAHV